MCAITGLITRSDLDQNNFKAMNSAAAHRGPDGEGFYFDRNIALGHRRLAIIDLSSKGKQPMEKDGLQITYNGEIYNYRELRTDLEALGHVFVSESDTEVILSAYRQWGAACVKKLNGMWGFAIFDKAQGVLFCSRDRFGVKPFYYVAHQDFFVFASEIRQILTCSRFRKNLNRKAVSKYLVSSLVDDGNETFFQDILKLPAGHNMTVQIDSLKISISKYYDIERENTSYSPDDFHDTLIDAVRLRLRSDTPVGSCLSGGLDSSLIVSIASRLPTQGKFNTFTSIPFDKRFDESAYVLKLSKDLPIQTHFTTPQADDFQKSLLDVIELQEEPFLSPSIFMQYFVMRMARSAGLKVLLDGQGADEILLGYEKYFPSMLSKVFLRSPLRGAMLLKHLVTNNENVSLSLLAKVKAKSILTEALSPQARALREVTQQEFAQDESYANVNLSTRDYAQYRISDIVQNNLPALLRYEDKNSMHFGVETRLPYLDYRVVDIALKMPVESLITKGLAKAPLRTRFNDVLPNYIAERRSKFNFNAPEGIWKNEAAALLSQSPSTEYFFKHNLNIAELSGIQPWKVLNLCLWHDLYFGN